MDKVYNHQNIEDKIYQMWKKNGYFKPEIRSKGKPYCIILPPPNANAPLHFGHAMYVIEDILIRYHRMKGYKSLWLPGADHAGFETQFVFEKKLQEEGKSRFDYSREELYRMIWDHVQKNKSGMEGQLRKLGFSLDWSREKFTLDKDIITLVYKTFKKMYDEGLIYRGLRLVNYCTKDGTSFSDLEVVYDEKKTPLYYIKYGPLSLATTRPETKFGDTAVAVNPGDKRYQQYIGKEIEIETVLGKAKIKVIADKYVDPEFGTGVVKITPAHDFNDFEVGKRHNLEIRQVIGFDGKMNAHAGKFAGIHVKKARTAIVEEMQKKGLMEKIDTNYVTRIGHCYKCKTVLEPLPLEQWFVKVKPLAEKAIRVVKERKIKIFPANFTNHYNHWLKNLNDWNISRQIVWGIRIPAWFCGGPDKTKVKKIGVAHHVVRQFFEGKTKTYRIHPKDVKIGEKVAFEDSKTKTLFGYGIIENIEKKRIKDIDLKDAAHGSIYTGRKELINAFRQYYPPEEEIDENTKSYIYSYKFIPIKKADIKKGCGQIIISDVKPQKCPACGNTNAMKQDPDTFDTWFSSAQWPYVTLQTTKKGDFNAFYPTSVMETGYDILRAWVSRMVMMGLYRTGEVPFRHVVLHGLVNDPLGKKMSKSKGNVVNPIEIADKYGADAIRFALVYGTALGHDQSLSYPKLDAMRKFSNKLWNIARFIDMKRESLNPKQEIPDNLTMKQFSDLAIHTTDKEWIKKVENLAEKITVYLDSYQFNLAAERLYEFTWHEFADKYIEDVKNRMNENSYIILNTLYIIQLKLLHPFMPFITEEIYQKLAPNKKKDLAKKEKSIMIKQWPSP